MRFIFVALMIGLFSACNNQSDQNPPQTYSFTTDNLASQGQWIYGTWNLQGEPASYGDLGADARNFVITPEAISYDVFGHLAAESYLFNTDGYDFGGNCLFRVHSAVFGTKTTSQGVSLFVGSPSYELISDPGNRSDCDQQIARINSVVEYEHLVFDGFQQVDAETFEITPQGLSFDGEKKVYKLGVNP